MGLWISRSASSDRSGYGRGRRPPSLRVHTGSGVRRRLDPGSTTTRSPSRRPCPARASGVRSRRNGDSLSKHSRRSAEPAQRGCDPGARNDRRGPPTRVRSCCTASRRVARSHRVPSSPSTTSAASSTGARPTTCGLAQLPTWHRSDVAGIPTVSAARAVVDRCRHVEFRDCLIVGDAALHLGRSTPTEIHEAIDFCTGWAGIRGARTAAAYFDGRRESPLESLSYAAFVQHGLPLPACQVPIVDDWGELLGIVDFYWRELGVIGEADGRLKYCRSQTAASHVRPPCSRRSTARNSSRTRPSSCVGAGRMPPSRTAYHSYAASRRRFAEQRAGSDQAGRPQSGSASPALRTASLPYAWSHGRYAGFAARVREGGGLRGQCTETRRGRRGRER